jgi:23S rRNA (adenine2030-N6)-methyltransferase
VNYRHVFHAGNFADVIKHAALSLAMDRLMASPEPLLVVDSHAGAGTYDLTAAPALKSGEAEVGVGKLMADDDSPEAFRALKSAVRAANPGGGLRVYPGSPALIAGRLRRGDEYVGAELQPDDFDALRQALRRSGGPARAVSGDGYDLVARSASDPRRLFVLIDPPFERPDDYPRVVEALKPVFARSASTSVLVWLPLKDLETFDALLRRLELANPPPALIVEARLYPLTDPMRLNGCALVLFGEIIDLEPKLQSAAQWVVAHAGGPGGVAKLWALAP